MSGESAQLSVEFSEIHQHIQENNTHTYLPECWAGLIPLKGEYYKAVAHYHAAKSINNDQKSIPISSKKEISSDTFIFDESSIDGDMSPIALKRAHLKESLASHEEAQRLQRMCRELKNKEALTIVLKEAHSRTIIVTEILNKDNKEKIIDEDYELLDARINACSKFTLSLTGPDFTSYKIEDPFKKLGPIAIFSARRHWTAPRSVRLQKGNNESGRKNRKCQCKKSVVADGQCEVCSKYSTFSPDDRSEDTPEGFGFLARGDAPVIISNVEINSLADVSFGFHFSFFFN